MTSSPYSALDTAIHSRLTGGTALITEIGGTAIYHGYAPEKQTLPFVVWSHAAGGAENLTPRASVAEVIYIRAYAETAKKAAAIDKQVAALMESTLTVTGWSNYWLAREDEYFLPETDEAGKRTWSCGANYRVRLD